MMSKIDSKFKRSALSGIRLNLWVVTLLVSVGFSSWLILVSLQRGSLALPPTYDDIEYFRDAAFRLNILKTSGFVEFLKYYITNPPHSPLSMLLALIGFSAFGLHPWAAVAINTSFVILLIRIFLGATHSIPFFVGVASVLGMLLHPYLSLLILEFRPDPAAGVLTALGCAVLIIKPLELRSAVYAGVLCGFALLAKPSIFFLTCLLFGVAFILSSLNGALNKDWSLVFRRLWRLGAATFAVAGLHYIIAASEIWGYVYQTIWGSTSAYWVTPMPLYQKLVTYLIGKGGKFGMGWWLFLAPVFIVLYLQLSKLRSIGNIIRDPVIQLIGVATVAWAFVSFAPIKTIFLGLTVSAFNLVVIGVCYIRICKIDKSYAPRLVIAMLALGYVDYMQPWNRRSEADFTPEYAKNRHAVLNELVDKLNALPDIQNSNINLPISSFSINEGILDFTLAKRGTFIKFSGNAFSFDPVDYKSKKWNYLVEISGSKKKYDPTLPNYKVMEEIHNVIRQDPAIELIHAIPDPESDGVINIYKKK